MHLEDRSTTSNERPQFRLTLEPDHERRLDVRLLTRRRPGIGEKSRFMIAPDGEHPPLFQEGDNLVRKTVLSDGVTEAEHLADRPHELEGAQKGTRVAVYVRL